MNAVPQRAPKVSKSLELLRNQDEFRLGPVSEADVLEKPWNIAFIAPSNSPYHPQEMQVLLTFPARYPFEPPSVKFITRLYHPNIDGAGTICLDLLKPLPTGSWKPSIDVITLLTAVKLLLAEPNPDDPLMPDIAALYREDIDGYTERAKLVSVTGVFPVAESRKPDSLLNGEVKVEKKSLLKKRTFGANQLEGETKKPITAPTAPSVSSSLPTAVPIVVSLVEDEENRPCVGETINLISDDDEFEKIPARPVKKQLLSSSKK